MPGARAGAGSQECKSPGRHGILFPVSFRVTYVHRLCNDISFVDVLSMYLEEFPNFPHHNWECRKLAISVSLSLKGKLRLSRNHGTLAAEAFTKDTPPSPNVCCCVEETGHRGARWLPLRAVMLT